MQVERLDGNGFHDCLQRETQKVLSDFLLMHVLRGKYGLCASGLIAHKHLLILLILFDN